MKPIIGVEAFTNVNEQEFGCFSQQIKEILATTWELESKTTNRNRD